MSDRVTISICPSESTPQNLRQSNRLTNRTVENIAGTLKGNFGCSLDIERIRKQFADPECALSPEQVETVKEVARVAVAACVGSLLHQNYGDNLRRKSAERAAKEREQREAEKAAARKAQEEASVAHTIETLTKASDEKVLELAARIEAARKAKQEGADSE